MPILRNQRSVPVGATDTPLVPGATNRVALLIGAPTTAAVWLSFVGPAAVGTGIRIPPGSQPLKLDAELYAEALTDEIRAITESGTENVGVVEFTR